MTKQRIDNAKTEARGPTAELSDTELEKATGGGDKDAQQLPTETLSLNFGKIEWTYTQ